jgi:hypothetical protein
MALPTGGYSYTPQTENLGASPLSALKPLDVGVSIQFTPMPKYEVPSAQQELVSMGAAKGFQALAEPIIGAFKAKDDEAKEADKEALKYLRDINIAKIKAEKTPMELAYEQARYNDLLLRTKERGGDKVPVRSRPRGAFEEKEVRKAIPASETPIVIPPVEEELPTGPTSVDDPTPLLPPVSSVDEEFPTRDLSGFKRGGVLADISFQQPSAIATSPFEPVISQEQILAVTNPPLTNIQASTGGIMVPPAPIPQVTPTPTPAVLPATAVTTQPSSFKSNPAMLAKLEENRVKMIQEATGADEALQNQERVDEEVGNLTELPYESAADARAAATRIQKLLPNYNPPKITRETDKELGRSFYYVEQPEINEKYVAPGSTPKLSADQAKLVLAMQGDLEKNPTYSKALIFRDSKNTIFTSLSKENGFSDIAAINAFQRLIDPGVAVREGDVALMQSAIAFLNKYDPKFITEKFSKGAKLPPADRENMRQLTTGLVRIALENANKESIPRIRKLASDSGLDPDYIIQPFDIPLDKEQLKKEIDVLKSTMKSIPKSQANDPASQELIKKYQSLLKQLQQAE